MSHCQELTPTSNLAATWAAVCPVAYFSYNRDGRPPFCNGFEWHSRATAYKMADMHVPGHPSLISTTTFCDEAGISPEALQDALAARRVFAVEMHGQLLVPDFYLDARYDRRQLESICKVLGDLPGGSKLQFFTTPKGSLGGRTPLDALADGDVALVRRAAQGFVER